MVTSYLDGPIGTFSDSSLQAVVSGILAPMVERLAVEPVPEVWASPEGAWPTIMDCAALEDSSGLTTALSSPHFEVRDLSGRGEDYIVSREAASIGGATTCDWRAAGNESWPGELAYVSVSLLSGGAWYWDSPIFEATTLAVTPISVEGADDAAIICTETVCGFEARTGLNAVRIVGASDWNYTYLSPEQLTVAGTAIIAGLTAGE